MAMQLVDELEELLRWPVAASLRDFIYLLAVCVPTSEIPTLFPLPVSERGAFQ